MIFKLMKNEFFLEKKSSFNLLYISFFAISCLMFLLFSFPLAKIYDSTVFAGFFWIIISLSTIKLIENSFAREKDYNIYDLIYSSKIDLNMIYFAKIFSLSLIMLGVQFIIFFGYLIFSNLSFSIILNLILLSLVANFGLLSFGILIFLLTNTNTSKSFLFPVIFFPLIIPILINASNILFGIIVGDMSTLYIESWLILLTFALTGILLGINLFERLIKQ
jgi:heme exporter protein B|tara:strand:+ start:454 stop:1113 length:660 start_codon:yes stop_codon:yes gene_type:complete